MQLTVVRRIECRTTRMLRQQTHLERSFFPYIAATKVPAFANLWLIYNIHCCLPSLTSRTSSVERVHTPLDDFSWLEEALYNHPRSVA